MPLPRTKTPLAVLIAMAFAAVGGPVGLAGCNDGDNRAKQGDPSGQGETSPTATPSVATETDDGDAF